MLRRTRTMTLAARRRARRCSPPRVGRLGRSVPRPRHRHVGRRRAAIVATIRATASRSGRLLLGYRFGQRLGRGRGSAAYGMCYRQRRRLTVDAARRRPASTTSRSATTSRRSAASASSERGSAATTTTGTTAPATAACSAAASSTGSNLGVTGGVAVRRLHDHSATLDPANADMQPTIDEQLGMWTLGVDASRSDRSTTPDLWATQCARHRS